METVAVRRCESYDQDKVDQAVSMAISDLGGIEQYVRPGDNVFLKINLLMSRRPEENVTTRPAVIEAVVKEIQSAGGKVVIGDSPGGPYNEKVLKTAYKVCGIEGIAKRTGAALNFDTSVAVIKSPLGKMLKSITVIRPLADADVVISVPKLKTHSLTTFTGAVKLMFGCIPGNLKAEYHVRMPEIKDFADALLDICIMTKPGLVIMDAIEAMEGNGPSGGSSRKLNCLLCSDNPFYIDGAAAQIIGLKTEEAPTIRSAIARGIYNVENLRIVGDGIEQFISTDFKVPNKREADMLSTRIPDFMKPFIKRYIKPKPEFNWDKCKGCGYCADNCPPKAIVMIDGRPHVNTDKCIGCFCCQELCMHKAVDIKRPWINKFIFFR